MVQFWYGSTAQYTAVTAKDNDTLYFLTDQNGGIYKGATKIAELSKDAITEIQEILGDISQTGYDDVASGLKALTDAITTLNANDTTAGSVKKAIKDAITALDLDNTYDAKGAADAVLGTASDTADNKTVYGAFAAVADEASRATTAETGINTALAAEAARAKAVEGNLESLDTADKDNLVAAVNKVVSTVAANKTASEITLTTSDATEGQPKVYTIKQGGNTIGVIDIPANMVLSSGEVEVNPEGKDPGTYLKLTFSNVADPLYINVNTLVDLYNVEENPSEIAIAINPNTRVISATLVAGSVTTEKIADSAIVTAKIANGNVTKEKLSTALQGTLDLADNAVQSITEGSSNGTISVDGTNVAVHGLKSAAYTESTAYDAAGAADNVKTTLEVKITALENALTWKTAAV